MDLNNRKNIVSLVILDIVVMLAAAAVLFTRFNTFTKQDIEKSFSAPPKNVSTVQSKDLLSPDRAELSYESKTGSVTAPEQKVSTELNSADDSLVKKRNIKFTFRNSKAHKVDIIGDFNEWIPQNLEKGENYTWAVAISLAPGEYAYNFVVNGRPIKDPNNPKTVNTGRGFTSSFLKVNTVK